MKVVPIYEMTIYNAFLVFIIFSVIGWISEVIFVGLFVEHKFVNRGFLHGPLCPIYGFGGLVILLLPSRLYSTWIPLFLASMVLCTVVEYFSSWILEKLFHTLWWDYSKLPLNIHGRVCLFMSVLFGFLGLFVIRFAMPYIVALLNSIGIVWAKRVALIILAIMLVDVTLTVRKLVDFRTALVKIKEFGESLKTRYGKEEWFKGNTISEMITSIETQDKLGKEKIHPQLMESIKRLQQKHPTIERFLLRFPTIRSRVYPESMNLLKHHFLLRQEKENLTSNEKLSQENPTGSE